MMTQVGDSVRIAGYCLQRREMWLMALAISVQDNGPDSSYDSVLIRLEDGRCHWVSDELLHEVSPAPDRRYR